MDLSREINLPSLSAPEPESQPESVLSEGHIRAIVGMFAHGTSIPQLASYYKVSQAEIRKVLRPYVTMRGDRD